MPTEARRLCLGSRAREACPRLVPEAPYEAESGLYDVQVFPGVPGAAEAFNLQWGAEDPDDPDRNRPPRLAHVVVEAGRLEPATNAQAGDPREGLLRTERDRYVALGRATWAGRSGELLLAPPYPRGGVVSNHAVFRWRDGATEYAVSIHAWEPFPESLRTLRAVVESIR